jgi:hypothetical protein
MFAQYLTIVLVNTYSWFGGQGYCSYEFAIQETEFEYSNVAIVLRPQFDPANTASGNTTLDDQVLEIAHIGGARVDWAQSGRIETDCNLTGFDIVKATGLENGQTVDLLGQNRISIETYSPLPITLGGR